MRSSFITAALMAGLSVTSALSVPAKVEKRSLLSDLGVSAGTNADSDTADAWLGNSGEYVTEFINNSGEDMEVVVWGPDASWVNVDTPLITQTLTNGSAFNVSFASGVSGAWAAVWADTELSDGQIAETWGEYTFDGDYSTFDVSRLVNMDGHDMKIHGSECVSNMYTCVFVCEDDETSCWETYTLENCESETGSEDGTYDGAASGGCLVGDNTFLQTIWV